jgi:hypothetical protein
VITGVGTAIGPTTSRFVFLHAHTLIPLFVWLVARKRSWAVSFAVVGFVRSRSRSCSPARCLTEVATEVAFGAFSIV